MLLNLKIWSFFGQKAWTNLLEKNRFLDKMQASKKDEKMKSGLELNRKFFVRVSFPLKNDSQRSFLTNRDP